MRWSNADAIQAFECVWNLRGHAATEGRDTMPKGGFGNLIALRLQKSSGKTASPYSSIPICGRGGSGNPRSGAS